MDLTKKEREVVDLLCEGLSKQQIADKLFVQLCTVSTHIKNIFAKNNVHTVGQICGLVAKQLKKENKLLKKQIKYYAHYKKMWDCLKLREYQERRG